MSDWKEISIHDIKGIKIGHAQDEANATGCSVIICDKKAICGVDVRGGGPASRETELLNPKMSNDGINGLLFKSGDINSLTQKVEWLLTHKEEIARIQRNAYMTMRNAWNPKNAAANLLQLINDLKNGKDTSIIDGPCSKDF